MMKKIKCYKCGKMFEDINYKKEYKSAVRLYCDECVEKLWNKKKIKYNMIHTLNSIKKDKKVYNHFKQLMEERLKELEELKNLHERNLKFVKLQIKNNQMILKSQLPIEKMLRTKK